MNWLTNRHLLLVVTACAVASAALALILLLREGRSARRLADLRAAILRLEAEQVPSLRHDLSEERSASSSHSDRLAALESRLEGLTRLQRSAAAQGEILERLVVALRTGEEGGVAMEGRIIAQAGRIVALQREVLRLSHELAALRTALGPPAIPPGGAAPAEKPAALRGH